MLNKKGLTLFITFLLVIIPTVYALGGASTPTTEQQGIPTTEVQLSSQDVPTGPEWEIKVTEDGDQTAVVPKEGNFQIEETTTPDLTWETSEGSFSAFSMTNALFSLGSLIQGSFISFENNNNIFFSSLFDASKFTATLDDEGELNVGQRNSQDLGRVFITINNGNLTQDEYVVFIPEGNEPTYIYYNTTEIEFKDGNVSLLGEIVSNNDDSEEKTKVQFNENGFTKVELPVENIYTINDYSIQNNEERSLIICKKDPLCDVNIDENVFTIKGKVNFSYKERLIYESFDENNEIVLDYSSNTITFNNPLADEETSSVFYNDHFRILENNEGIYYLPTEEAYPNNFKTYNSLLNEKTLILEDSAVYYENFAAFNPESTKYQECLENQESCIQEKQIQQAPSLNKSSYLIYTLLIAIVLIMILILHLRKKPKRKGQATLFIIIGIMIVILVLGIFAYFKAVEQDSPLDKIESLQEARMEVENCIDEKIEEKILLWGDFGGYTTEQDSYSLLAPEEMQYNLKNALQRELADCGEVLEGTPYHFEDSGRIALEVIFEDGIQIEGGSIGSVNDDEGTSETIQKINYEYEVDMLGIYSLTEELINSENGVPIISSTEYKINIFTNEDYNAMLIEIQQDNPYFRFRATKYLL
jgi:hypothetical protein